MKPDNKEKKKDNSANILLAVAALLAVGLIAWLAFQGKQTGNGTSPVASQVQLPTLSPEMFTGKTRDAYQAAKDVPEVLASVPCYCGCMQNNGHQHNLHCFMDEHAVG
jgi:hypothetical protein